MAGRAVMRFLVGMSTDMNKHLVPVLNKWIPD